MNDQLDLAALFAHPANGGLRPIAAADPSVVWRELVVASTESELAADGGGALAVLTVAPPATPWQQDALVRRVRDHGYRGL
ncbi:hypothetical protein N136_01294, partial [Leifsonia aquatica ATCC 14665]